MRAIISILLFAAFSCTASGQQKNQKENTKNTQTMNLDQITNEKVKSAIQALQDNDLKAWKSHFTDDAVFTDDGNEKDFDAFFENAFNHKEKFLTIDKVEDGGKHLAGDFYAGQWGTFHVFFKFHENGDGKFNRVDIGQTSKL